MSITRNNQYDRDTIKWSHNNWYFTIIQYKWVARKGGEKYEGCYYLKYF